MITREFLNSMFATLRAIHKAHWKVPTLEAVEAEIASKGVYVFRIGGKQWIAEAKISKSVEYIVNPLLSDKMKKVALEYKKKFDEWLTSSYQAAGSQ